jgi:hypothetical protein
MKPANNNAWIRILDSRFLGLLLKQPLRHPEKSTPARGSLIEDETLYHNTLLAASRKGTRLATQMRGNPDSSDGIALNVFCFNPLQSASITDGRESDTGALRKYRGRKSFLNRAKKRGLVSRNCFPFTNPRHPPIFSLSRPIRSRRRNRR